jgi:hypothetical protein
MPVHAIFAVIPIVVVVVVIVVNPSVVVPVMVAVMIVVILNRRHGLGDRQGRRQRCRQQHGAEVSISSMHYFLRGFWDAFSVIP